MKTYNNIRLLLIAIIFLTIISCKNNKETPKNNHVSIYLKTKTEAKKQDSTKKQIFDDKELKNILKQQLAKGKSALYDDSFDVVTYKYSQKDLDVILPFLKENLIGYDVPSNIKFKKIIKQIFGRTVDFASNSNYLYVNFNNKLDRAKKFYRNDNSIQINPFAIFIIKKGNFITPLYSVAEILNYKNIYPEISKFENKVKINQKNKNGESIKG